MATYAEVIDAAARLLGELMIIGLFATAMGRSSWMFKGPLKRTIRHTRRTPDFRRFLPETVASAVVAHNATNVFQPHRAAITVVFCDLRGFTRFAAAASPEDLLEVLEAYFAVIGGRLNELGATVSTFSGDGIMAFFGDPRSVEDPCERAVEFSRRVREPMAELVGRWNALGFGLSYGIGIAHGHATLGMAGYDGRYDYVARGPVVNLAARLSDAAGPGETLIDQRAVGESHQRPETVQRSIALKGYDQPVTVHVLTDARRTQR